MDLWIVAQRQTEMAGSVQRLTDQGVATHTEIGSSNMDLLNGLALEQVIQHIGEAGLYIVDDIRERIK